MKCRTAPAVALAGVLVLCSDGWAGSPTEQLRGFFAAATRVLDGSQPEGRPEQRLRAIRAIVSDAFDFSEAAQLSLGADWNARTPAEREEFIRLFAGLLERSFIVGIAARIHPAGGVKVSYLDESVDGALATVRTTIVSKSGLELPFTYRMIQRGDRWAVRDVVIDGVSLAANYRAQFLRVIQASSYLGLVRRMQARLSRTLTPVGTPATDGQAIAPVMPVPPPIEPARTESPEVTSWQASPETSPDFHGHDLTMAARSAPGPQPEAILIARAPLEPPTIRPPSADADGSARQGSGPTAPRPERRIEPNELPVVTAARSAGTRAASGRSYWVQVGAFKHPEAARRLASRLRAQTPRVSNPWVVVVGAGSTGTPLARVRVGPFSGRAEAASTLHELQIRGYTPFIAEERD